MILILQTVYLDYYDVGWYVLLFCTNRKRHPTYALAVDGKRINTWQPGGHNEWPCLLGELLNDEVGGTEPGPAGPSEGVAAVWRRRKGKRDARLVVMEV